MVIVFIVLLLVVVTCVGKLVNSRGSSGQNRSKFLGMRSPESTFDREENPRHDGDGTSFGYRPGD
jgi:Na+-transporting methylmalonyl-CoA/oxaloacetate decarboxylase gamma subunit